MHRLLSYHFLISAIVIHHVQVAVKTDRCCVRFLFVHERTIIKYSLMGARTGYDATNRLRDERRAGQQSLVPSGTGYDVASRDRDKQQDKTHSRCRKLGLAMM